MPAGPGGDHRGGEAAWCCRGSPAFSGVKPVAASLQRADMGGSLNTRELLDIAGGAAARPAPPGSTGTATGRRRPPSAHLFHALTPNRFLEDKHHRLHRRGGGAGRLGQPGAGLHPPAYPGHREPRCGTFCRSSSPPTRPSTSRRPSSPMRSDRYVVPVKSEYKNDDPRPGPRRVLLGLHLLHRAHGGGEGQQRAAGAARPRRRRRSTAFWRSCRPSAAALQEDITLRTMTC